jgi:hypothetical protein
VGLDDDNIDPRKEATMAKDLRRSAPRPARIGAPSNGVETEVVEGPQKTAKKVEDEKLPRITLQLTPELDFVLSSLARFQKRTKQDLAVHLLSTGCARYSHAETLQNVFAEIHRQSKEAA